ncbi:MAG: glutamate formimidoyltransferase [Bacteroidota bacterium]
MNPILECVPNFSEGRNQAMIDAIASAIRAVEGVQLLHIDVGFAANRTVMTFVGQAGQVVEAAFRAIRTASELIDMRQHQGEHPRIGATDVCPLIPIAGIELEEVVTYATQLASRVGTELDIPVYLYEAAAQKASRKNLATIRKGEYEGLAQKMESENWQPDFGKDFNARSGATVIGARNFLIAYNVNLNTDSVAIANEIAQEIRESGKIIVENGEKKRIKGKYKSLKAIGWYIKEYGKAQVSMNLTDYNITGMHHVFEACQTSAARLGVEVTGSELIGLVPLDALLAAGKFYQPEATNEVSLLEVAVKVLGLSDLAPFNIEERVIERLMESIN